jgi:thioredoxin-like negative regulator of GroEL
MMTPTVDAVATEYVGRAKVGKLNVDENGQTAMRYNIRGIPTLLLFKGGRIVEQKVGAVGKTEVHKMLDAHVQDVAATSTQQATQNGAAQKDAPAVDAPSTVQSR